MVKLIETRNARATKLYLELRQELKEWENKNGYTLINPIAYIDDSIGTYKSTRAIGKCNAKRVCGMILSFNIYLNKELVNNGTDKDIKDVLIHELIHTTSGCFNHRNTFKHKASIIKHHLGYDGLKNKFENKCTSDKGKRDITYKCINCGKLFKRYRHIDTKRYTCPCHGKLELVLDF